MSTITTIVFDLGDVLVDWNPEYVYSEVFHGNMKKTSWFLNTVCTSDWNIEQDAGRTIKEAEALKIKEFPEYEDLIKIYYRDWEFMFSGAIQENVELFKKLVLSKNYKVYALTNWSAETWPKALELFPFLNDFDGVVVSGKEKTRKPFNKIYKILFSRYSIQPESAVFIDDNSDNVKTAKKLGMNAIHYQGNTTLQELLKEYNLNY